MSDAAPFDATASEAVDAVPTLSSPQIPADELALIERLRAGDEGAFEELIRAYGGIMFAVIKRILHHEEDARDAWQETFLAAHRNIGQFAGQARLKTWLHRIAVNNALMKLRARKRKPAVSMEQLKGAGDEQRPSLDPADPAPAAPEQLGTEEVRAQIRDAIAELPEDYRNVILLRDIQGLDTQQAADALQISVSAAKVRLHRARLALKKLLEPRLDLHAPPGA